MNTTRKVVVVALAAWLGSVSFMSYGEDSTRLAAAVAGYDAPVSFDLNFIFHIDEDLVEQDVFVEREPGSDLVYRPSKNERDLSQPLYASAAPVEHQPFDPDAMGPWQKGKALGLTLGDWFAAEGKGSYTCQDGKAHVLVRFKRLVPNGVYTMWHDFMAWPPTEPFTGTYDLPIGARDGSESVFRADAEGHAVVERRFRPCLQLSGEHLMSDLAIAYHSDGETHGPVPGEFGNKTHVHMYLALPKRSGI